MRTLIQALSLLLFSALFYFATYKLPNWLPADIYLRLDPLLGLNAVFAAREIIGRALWSLVTLRHHWGSFKMAFDGLDEPKEVLLRLYGNSNLKGRIHILENGGKFLLGERSD